jgi:alkylated DNA repair dioxygenase AlkB
MTALPLSLFATGEPALAANPSVDRTALDDACWVDVAPGWLEGADALLDELLATLPWRQGRRLMWNAWVDEPRLTCGVHLPSGPPMVRAMARALARTYATPFDSCWCNHYRDGRDSVAWHGDRIGKVEKDPLVAIVSLGGPRSFALRPREGGRSRQFVLHSGDLLVMGGATQHRWQHAVPKCAHAAPRMSVTFRHLGEP